MTQFVVSLFAKLRVQPGQRAPKGEEIKVTLATDPGEGFEEDIRVELVDARLNAYQIETEDGRSISGISFKAMGLNPVGAPAASGAGERSDAHPGQGERPDVDGPLSDVARTSDARGWRSHYPHEDRVVIGLDRHAQLRA